MGGDEDRRWAGELWRCCTPARAPLRRATHLKETLVRLMGPPSTSGFSGPSGPGIAVADLRRIATRMGASQVPPRQAWNLRNAGQAGRREGGWALVAPRA